MAASPIRLGISGVGADEATARQKPQAQEFDPTPMLQAGYSQEDANFAKDAIANGYTIEEIDSFLNGQKQAAQPKQPRKNTLKGRPDKPWTANDVVEAIRPFISGAVGVGTGAAGVAVPIPGATLALGGLGYMGTDLAIKGLQKEFLTDEKSELTSQDMIDSGIDAGINEVGGRVFGGLIKGGKGIARAVKEYRNPGSIPGVTDDSIFGLDPTFSQAHRKLKGTSNTIGNVSKWIEDIFASGQKAAAMENSAALARQEGLSLSTRMTKRTPSGTANPEWLGDQMKTTALNNMDLHYKASKANAEFALVIAKSNPLQLDDGRVISGPINIPNTVKLAQEFIDHNKQLIGDLTKLTPDKQERIAAAQHIINVAKPMYDDAGNLVRSNPISFEDAWNFKKNADTLGSKDTPEGATAAGGWFRKIANSLNEDIDNGIQFWPNDPGGRARRAWLNSKRASYLKSEYYGEDGLRQLINANNSPKPDIDRILNDPKELQRALNSGVAKLPIVSPNGKSIYLKSKNMRGDLQGYELQQIMNESWKFDPLNPSKGYFKVEDMTNRLNDLRNYEKYRTLFGAQARADINQFMKNLAYTSEKMTMEGKWLPRVIAWKGTAALSGALLGAGAFNLTPYQGGAVTLSALALGGIGIGRLLTNPKTARPLIALAAGQPAGMSDVALGRLIMGALQGTYVTMIDSEGKETQARVSGSQLEPVE